MKLIPVPNWRAAALATRHYRISAANVDDAIKAFKRRFAAITPDVCYWYPATDTVNHYCFTWSEEAG